ncbi:MAG: hypothetical protein ABUL62_29405 [Myxococcales bacterium]
MRIPLTESSFALRVWRATAIGFSVTALGLAALCPSPIRSEVSEAVPSSPGHAVARRAAAEPDAARPSGSRAAAAAAPNEDAAVADLARRFSEAADADLPELATALATLGGPRARQVLFTAARSSRPSSQIAALEALATIDTPDVRELMLAELNEREPLPAVITYFTDCQEPRALPALERLAHEAPTELRSVAISSLFAQGESAMHIVLRLVQGDDQLADALLQTAPISARMRRVLRQASVQRLRAGAITQGPVFDFLEQDLSPEARAALIDAAHDPASAARAVAALFNRGDRESLSALGRLANDSDRNLAARAACALRPANGSRAHRIQPRYIQ